MRISDWSSDVCSSDLLIVYSGLVPMSPKTTPTAPTISPARPTLPWPSALRACWGLEVLGEIAMGFLSGRRSGAGPVQRSADCNALRMMAEAIGRASGWDRGGQGVESTGGGG